jgi:hypothetical protein
MTFPFAGEVLFLRHPTIRSIVARVDVQGRYYHLGVVGLSTEEKWESAFRHSMAERNDWGLWTQLARDPLCRYPLVVFEEER